MDVMELCGCETFVSSSRLRYKYNIINYYTLTDNSKLYIYLFIQCSFGVLKTANSDDACTFCLWVRGFIFSVPRETDERCDDDVD